MRNYVLIMLFALVCTQQLKSAAMMIPQRSHEQKLREHLYMTTPLPRALCDMVIAYMRAYVPAFNLAHESSVLAISSSSDGKWIATAGYKGIIYVWDALTQKAKLFYDYDDPVTAVSFSPNTKLLATVGYNRDYAARIWCTGSGQRLSLLQGHRGAMNAVSFDPTGGHLVTASDDNTMRFWDVETATSLFTFKRHTKWVCSAAFDASGNQLISASNDKTVRIWDIRSGLVVQNLFGHKDHVNSAAFSSKRIITASDDQTVRIWNPNARVMGILPIGGKVKSAMFNSDGRYILTAGEGKVAYIWNATTQEIVQKLDTGSEPVYAASFGRSDAEQIITASKKRVLVWSLFDNQDP